MLSVELFGLLCSTWLKEIKEDYFINWIWDKETSLVNSITYHTRRRFEEFPSVRILHDHDIEDIPMVDIVVINALNPEQLRTCDCEDIDHDHLIAIEVKYASESRGTEMDEMKDVIDKLEKILHNRYANICCLAWIQGYYTRSETFEKYYNGVFEMLKYTNIKLLYGHPEDYDKWATI